VLCKYRSLPLPSAGRGPPGNANLPIGAVAVCRLCSGGRPRFALPRVVIPNRQARFAPCEGSGLKGVTVGDIRPELRLVGVTARVGAGNLKESDLMLKAGWGHAGKGGVTMPGRGRVVEREYSLAESKSLLEGSKALDVTQQQILTILGSKTIDAYLNDVAYWSNIPEKVWEYTIGGYQVIKKWLSYREEKLLGRPLTIDEVRYVQEMVRRIAALLLLQPALDANYHTVKTDAFPWPRLD
jgi:hypothetical protein